MPLYEYRCEKGHTFEVIQSITEDSLTECQECRAPARRVLHSPAIHFKGSGFHNTDYGTRSSNKAKQAAAAAKKEAGGDSDSGKSSGSGDSSGSSDSSGATGTSDSSSGSTSGSSPSGGSKSEKSASSTGKSD
ncbi:MAG: zinc ribbon domain-containing protein [Thermoleophilia bacterium]|nr:zinc ribbon domain-containing protein [Thermoleophilia bacterium]